MSSTDVKPEAEQSATISGRVDAIESGRVFGWAWDPNDPGRRLDVEIWLGDRLIGSTVADRQRSDLKKGGIGDGGHAFELALGEPINDDDKDRLSAVVVSPTFERPVPLSKPSSTQAAVERAVAVPLAQIRQVLERVAASQASVVRSQQALSDRLVGNGAGKEADGDDDPGPLVERLLEGQSAIEQQLRDLEVFQVRFDAALRAIDERSRGNAGNVDRGLRRMVAILAAATFLGFGLLLALVIGASG
ncbi:MAG TPA: hypothetical protein VFO41_14650 [Alphaproteobacteria bacterium]|nr:hypothetical protein [Alphaproteobacteria bacterium]